jgi:hypothetical protein
MTKELKDFLGDLEEIVFELEKDEFSRDFNPIERLQMMIVDLSDERQKTTDGYPVNRHSRVYSYSKSSTDGVPSIGDVR